ncbi:hypothetical protein LOTGIDRAFT_217090 [Lottia gigantea]|uniref:serine--tRNA ligase n=1 Tax=Lottia gigantea TaxID=225164 RepID=V4AA45_LOTGI|nr:hypothetical protein LOTGIDRAFT_217090 [Lottia gigantea]ESO91930.1 hypothetical protein LOTGIDRAFT_217090 [Lottia gigantea]
MNSSFRKIFVQYLRLYKTCSKARIIQTPCHGCRHHYSTSPLHSTSENNPREWQTHFKGPQPEFDWQYLCDPNNTAAIEENIKYRKGMGDIRKVTSLWKKYNEESEASHKDRIWKDLIKEASDIPNTHHPDSPIGEEENSRLVETVGEPTRFNFKPRTVVRIGEKLDILRTDNVNFSTGIRTYYFKDELVDLEMALIKFTLNTLKQHGFHVISVPDLIYAPVIEACGFKTTGENQVYKLNDNFYQDVCLAGTAEMSLAGFMSDEKLTTENLPTKLTAVSRCFRREASDAKEEQGIYRVHQFTKIEMFGVTENDKGTESEELLQHFLDIEKSLFSQLGLHFRILEMSTECLGAPAYRKYDMETWMPGKHFWGEISSASNCTDYQSRRLGIKYTDINGNYRHAHTVNGTACAIPRMIMAILEQFQTKDWNVNIPEVLQPYMNNKTQLTGPQNKHPTKWIKFKKLKNITS